jgi:hypothetical protein
MLTSQAIGMKCGPLHRVLCELLCSDLAVHTLTLTAKHLIYRAMMISCLSYDPWQLRLIPQPHG